MRLVRCGHRSNPLHLLHQNIALKRPPKYHNGHFLLGDLRELVQEAFMSDLVDSRITGSKWITGGVCVYVCMQTSSTVYCAFQVNICAIC